MAVKGFHQVMLNFRVPKGPPLEMSCPEVIIGNPTYVTGSFEGFVTKETNYATWFLASSIGPIIDDCLISRGRVLEGIAHARRALEAHLGSHVEALQVRVQDLEGVAITKEGYM